MSHKPALILASGSAGRKAMLQNAGLSFDAIPANIDEDAIAKNLLAQNVDAEKITRTLAREKSLHVSARYPDALIIGSDQTLVLNNVIFSKAKNKNDAVLKLQTLRGKTHVLNSALCVSQNQKVLFETLDIAQLSMHDFSDKFLKAYIETAGDTLTSCVGAYAIEGKGAWLFSEIKGDLFTIMGMPLLPLLFYLHDNHGIAP
jgi:septum formation protein